MKEIIEDYLVKWNDRSYNFKIRPQAGPGEEPCDKVVLREAFIENTYALDPSDFTGSGIFMDIGANIGAVSVLAAAMGARNIIAYEPVPDNYELLQQNLKANIVDAVVSARNLAIWGMPGPLRILSSQGGSTSEPSAVEAHPEMVITADAVTLRDALRDYTDIDVLKVDTEGAEYRMFLDPEVNIKAKKIVIEYHRSETIGPIGALLATLVLTHNVHAFGSWRSGGGQILALRY